ncbi:Ig-like domain-containing protein [Gilvimarinus sp. SDUM040013]|uniref:Ig-like domain-containing protein n=1 Tax=Gilvimarinus gilvus TaxID=3058038 RepID=A0ABU4S392_9GAMM|nr:Ig-like domain-containing protein [Gilvimarinus sp. SDUM040013]MDO3388132.1 Ig-like domain-containing protein [Gilvimarinus sp. SDUM040013]MDX6850293.1 Ig-like domain-containing protein [Gilvimarinus sp. SDUM040013]
MYLRFFLVFVTLWCSSVIAQAETPTKPVIAWLPSSVDQGDDIQVRWDMWWGANGTHWSLTDNGQEVCSGSLAPNGNNAQMGECVSTYSVGTHSLQVDLCNASGCTSSDAVTLRVGGGNLPTPAMPVIDWLPGSFDDGSDISVNWNMWWGTNGTSWSLTDNGQEVCSGSLTSNGNNAQQGKCVSTYDDGVHSLRVNLCNAAGCTSSDAVTLNIGATTTPGAPVMDWMPASFDNGSAISVTWHMWWGTNGTSWSLTDNGDEVCSGTLISNGKSEQSGSCVVDYAPGTHSLQVALCNNLGCAESDTHEFDVGGSSNINRPPLVSVTDVPAGFYEDSQVTFNASASDEDGSISRVEFFLNGTSIGVDTSAPYEVSWLATEGDHVLTANAIDNGGAITESSPVSFAVSSLLNEHPLVSVNTQSDSTVGEALLFSAIATDPDGSIQHVEFFLNGVSVGVDAVSPYEVSWVAVEGSQVLTAKATDNDSAVTESLAAGFTVLPIPNELPAVNVITQSESVVGEILVFSADAVDTDGLISQVEFFLDGVSVGVVTVSPYELNWTAVEGVHELIAKATDDDGGTVESAAYDFTVSGQGGNLPPTIDLTSEGGGSTEGDQILFLADAQDPEGLVDQVRFFVDGIWSFTSTEPPYEYTYNALSGTHQISAQVVDHQGLSADSNVIDLTVNGVSFSAPSEVETIYTYDDHGQVKTIDGPRTDVLDITTYDYDDNGNLSSITNALGHVTQFLDYNDHGDVGRIIDVNGVEEIYDYYPRGWLKSVTKVHPNNASQNIVVNYSYDDNGELTKVENPDGSFIEYIYDDASRLEAIENHLGDRIEYTLDDAGNRTQEIIKDSSGQLWWQVSRVYDELSRLRSITDGESNTASQDYDVNDNPTLSTNPRQYSSEKKYDAINRVQTLIDADLNPIKLTYNSQGDIDTVTDQRGLVTQYEYNHLGQLRSINSPDTGVTLFGYDGAGNIIARRDARGATTLYSYDALNRLVTETYPAQPSHNKTYGYDNTSPATTASGDNYGVGRLTSIKDFSGEQSYVYNHRGQLVEQLTRVGGYTEVKKFGYNIYGQLNKQCFSMQGNDSQGCIEYDYSHGRVAGVRWEAPGESQQIAADISYRPFGPLAGLRYGNNLQLSMDYDRNYSLRQYTLSSDSNTLIDISYDLDPNGNIDTINNAVDPSVSQEFDYDKLDRLVVEAGLYGDKSYTYDAVGNRTSQSHDEELRTLHYDFASNQLLGSDGISYQYDSSGNLATSERATESDFPESYIGTRLYKYNVNERLDAIYLNGQLQVTYGYNALGQRVEKQRYQDGQRAMTSVFFYNTSGHLSSEVVLDAENSPVERIIWIWFKSTPLAQVTQRFNADGSSSHSKLVYLHADHLNTPRVATDSVGSVVWRWTSDAFGLGSANEDVDGDFNKVTVNLRFPGQYFDEETGLHYNYYRNYDPSIGRYLQSDPIGINGGINTYSYSFGNPLFYFDFFGLAPGDLFETRDDAYLDAKNYARSMANQKVEYGGWLMMVKNCWTYTFLVGSEGGLPEAELEATRPEGSRVIWHTHPNTGDPRRRAAEESFSGNVEGTRPGDLTTARNENIGVYLNTPSNYNAYYDYYADPKLYHLEDRTPLECECQ